MKTPNLKLQFLALASALAPLTTRAIPYSFTWNSGFANAGVVPDGNVTGWSDTRIISGIAENALLDVNVTLQLAGGWNGDLYAYLSHSSGFAVLLNRAGRTASNPFGYGDGGLNITFDDAAPNEVHLYQSIPGYPAFIHDGSAWAPDGRNVDPVTTLESDPRTALLGSFNGLDPNGTWTLFIADLAGGDVSTVVHWDLNLDTLPVIIETPESGNTLAMLAGGLGILCLASRRHPRSRLTRLQLDRDARQPFA